MSESENKKFTKISLTIGAGFTSLIFSVNLWPIKEPNWYAAIVFAILGVIAFVWGYITLMKAK
jgi:hypothetical protein